MTRGQFSHAIDADEKWVENSARLLGRSLAYTPEEARWMRLVRILVRDFGLPLSRAAEISEQAVSLPKDTESIKLARNDSRTATLTLDLARYHSQYGAALSAALNLVGSRKRGRPSGPITADIKVFRPPVPKARPASADVSTIGPMIERLLSAKLAFVAIGGVAAVAHGSVRATDNLDICYDTSLANVTLLAKLLDKWEPSPRGVDPSLPFLWNRRLLRTVPMMSLVTKRGTINLFDQVEGVGSYKECRSRSVSVFAYGNRFRILDLAALIESKRAAGRIKDLEQIPELETLQKPRSNAPIDRASAMLKNRQD